MKKKGVDGEEKKIKKRREELKRSREKEEGTRRQSSHKEKEKEKTNKINKSNFYQEIKQTLCRLRNHYSYMEINCSS